MFLRYKRKTDQSSNIGVNPQINISNQNSDATNAEILKEIRHMRREAKEERDKIKEALKNVIKGNRHYTNSNGISEVDKEICKKHYDNAMDSLT